jgi:hypothetical protein
MPWLVGEMEGMFKLLIDLNLGPRLWSVPLCSRLGVASGCRGSVVVRRVVGSVVLGGDAEMER